MATDMHPRHFPSGTPSTVASCFRHAANLVDFALSMSSNVELMADDATGYDHRIFKSLSTLDLLWNPYLQRMLLCFAKDKDRSDAERLVALLTLLRNTHSSDEDAIFSIIHAAQDNMDRRHLLRALNWSSIQSEAIYNTLIREAQSQKDPQVALFAQQCLLQLPPVRWMPKIQLELKHLTLFSLKLMSIGYLEANSHTIDVSRNSTDANIQAQAHKTHAICYPHKTFCAYLRHIDCGKSITHHHLDYLATMHTDGLIEIPRSMCWFSDLLKDNTSPKDTLFYLGLDGRQESIPLCLKILDTHPDLIHDVELSLGQITGRDWTRSDIDENLLSPHELVQKRYKVWRHHAMQNHPRSFEGYIQRMRYTNIRYWRSRRREYIRRSRGTLYIPDLAPLSRQFAYLEQAISTSKTPSQRALG